MDEINVCKLYSIVHRLTRTWIAWACLLVAATAICGCTGFAGQGLSWTTRIYGTLQLFSLNGSIEDVGPWLEAARWLGAAVWAFAIVTVLVGLFGERVLAWYVAVCTILRFGRGHVLVAGLGDPGENRERLVERLRENGRDVIVLEPDADHPGLEACRAQGAICLIGSPLEPTVLRRGKLEHAGAFLALCDDDRQNVSLLGTVADELGGGSRQPIGRDEEEDPLAPADPDNVGCVVQVGEPGLLEVLRRHELHRDPYDRMHLRIFNVHEMVARTMLREALVGLPMPQLGRILVVGVGEVGRLGEALVVRAAKDRWIDRDPDADFEPLEVTVVDRDAVEWTKCLRERYEFLDTACRVRPHALPAARCGFRSGDACDLVRGTTYDVVFVCLADESQALMQTSQLRDVLPDEVPIVVRVQEERAGFGELLTRTDAGGLGPNIRVVGMHDRVFDIVASMHPMVEIVAQVLHQDYLAVVQRQIAAARAAGNETEVASLTAKESFRPWAQLDEDLHESNRALAKRLREHRTIPAASGGASRRFRVEFAPHALLTPPTMMPLTEEEVERIARKEHDLWCRDQRAGGWRKSSSSDPHASNPEQKVSPSLVDWEELDDELKEFDRNFARRLPFVFAKADYRVVEE